MSEKQKPLLDVLAESTGCTCLSDLRSVPQKKRSILAEKLSAIPSEAYSLAVWNDTLTYLTGEPAAATPEAARATLIHHYVKSGA